MSFFDRIIKNWKLYQVQIILLIFLFIILTFYQFTITAQSKKTNMQMQIIREHFASEENSKKLDNDVEIYFMINYPPQDVKKIWETQMGDERYISFWERIPSAITGYFPFGQIAFTSDEKATKDNISLEERPGIQYLVKGGKRPIDYTLVWDNSHNKDEKPISIWRPTPPENYVVMGDVAVASHEKPDPDAIHCLPRSVVENTGNIEGYLWKDPFPTQKTKDEKEDVSPHNSFSLWEIGSYGYFLGRDSYQKPDNLKDKIFKIKDEFLKKQEIDPIDDGKYIELTLKI
jgi:hypothetical protein